MKSASKEIINYFTQKPKSLFLIDSLGAILTSFLLFGVLKNFNEYFGMPKSILNYLSALAICFGFYSATCYILLKDNWAPFIRIIGIANILYCVFTIGLTILFYAQLTKLGRIYFLIELSIIAVLVFIELGVATEILKRKKSSNLLI